MPEKFTYTTLREVWSHSIGRLTRYPTRQRLEGMNRDLNQQDKIVMAYFEASVEVLNRLGVLDRDKLDAIMPAPFTASHEVLDEGIVGHTFTPHKK